MKVERDITPNERAFKQSGLRERIIIIFIAILVASSASVQGRL